MGLCFSESARTQTTTPSEMNKYTCDVLLLGLQSTGKTFLTKQLSSYLKGEDTSRNHFDIIPSYGVNLDDIVLPSLNESISNFPLSNSNQAASKKVTNMSSNATTIRVREVGGGLLLGWNKHYDDCRMILYVIDASNRMQLAASCIELLNLIHNVRKASKPFLILLNKM